MSKKVEDLKENLSQTTITDNDVVVALKRIEELNETRATIEAKKNEIAIHQKDLKAIETINGVDSNEWKIKKELINATDADLADANKKLSELVYKKSELKPVLDFVAKKFEDELRAEQEREYHIELGTTDEETGKNNGKKIYKELLEYVQKDVEWTAKSAPGVLMLERNMQENKAWVQSKDFDGVIILRSANVLVLWRSVLEDMHGKGSFEAKKFLTCWANCGKAITDAVRDIQKLHDETRVLGTNLNTIEDEFERSEDDLPHDEVKMTTANEVAPTV